MSLILDALRKSAGDRQRGHAPTLASSVGLTPRRRAHPARVPVALALLAGTAGAAWWLGFGEAPDGASAGRLAEADGASNPGDAVAPAAPDPAEAALASAPTLADAPPALRPETEQLPMDDLEPRMGESQSRMAGGLVAAGGAAALPLPAGTVYTPEAMASSDVPPAAEVPMPAPPPAASPTTEPAAAAPQAAAPAPAPVASVVPQSTTSAAPAAPTAPDESLATVDELDYSVRRELPPLDISMYVYNADPERRFLIIGGKRYPRMDATGSRITRIDDKVDLIEIRADGAVLEFNGQRFLLPRGR